MSDHGFANVSGSRHDLDISLQPPRPVPEERPKDTVVMVAQSVVEEVRRHGDKDTAREQGGVLVGTVASSRDKVYVTVEAAIPAPHARADRSSVTFTQESWGEINRVKDRQYPDQDIVGWYHTHPGFGVFLSDYDTFIHRNFFQAPWQVAFVVDPVSEQSGFFTWKDGEIVPSGQYNVFSPQKVERPQPPAQPEAPVWTEPVVAPPSVNIVTIAALMVLALQIVILAMLLRGGPSGLPVAGGGEAVATRLEAVQGELATSAATLHELAGKLSQVKALPLTAGATAAGITYEWYEVEAGDSLWRIAERHYDKGELYTLIAAENGIPLPAGTIVPGQKLRLPELPEEPDVATE